MIKSKRCVLTAPFLLLIASIIFPNPSPLLQHSRSRSSIFTRASRTFNEFSKMFAADKARVRVAPLGRRISVLSGEGPNPAWEEESVHADFPPRQSQDGEAARPQTYKVAAPVQQGEDPFEVAPPRPALRLTTVAKLKRRVHAKASPLGGPKTPPPEEGPVYFNDEERALREEIERNPKNASAHCELGKLLWEQCGRIHKAEASFRNAIKINHNSVLARVELGKLLYKRGREGDAELQFREAIRIDPVRAGKLMQDTPKPKKEVTPETEESGEDKKRSPFNLRKQEEENRYDRSVPFVKLGGDSPEEETFEPKSTTLRPLADVLKDIYPEGKAGCSSPSPPSSA